MAYDNTHKTDDAPETDEDLLVELKADFTLCEEHYSENYKQAKEDNDFLYGVGQWADDEVASRNRDRRPTLVLNQLLPFAHQVINDIKQARPAIRVSPVDENADIDTAEVFQGLIRNIERRSNANVAYDTAAMNSVGGGLGWIRITTDYVDEFSFDQEPKIERVFDFSSVYIDPHSQELDGSDMEYAYVFEDMSKDMFIKNYPDADVSSFGGGSSTWSDDETVRVAEKLFKEYTVKTIHLVEIMSQGGSKRGVMTSNEIKALEEEGVTVEVVKDDKGEDITRETELPVIKWCKFTDAEILEKGEWVGKYIPIVPVYGEEVWLDDKRQFQSLIRPAKDGQRMYNYHKSASTEIIGLQPKAPYIAPKGSFKSFPEHWRDANIENYSHLEYDIVVDKNGMQAPPPQRAAPILGSPAMMQEAQSSLQDIRNSLGMHESSMGQQGNEISGIAVRNRQIYGDNSNFHFMDNLSASISRVGCILVDLIPRLYSKAMIVRVLGEDGTEENIPINQGYKVNPDTGDKMAVGEGEKSEGIYKLNAGKYDVVCDVGASYSSKRQEFADKGMELLKASPEIGQVGADLIVASMDLPMAKELSERIKSQMPPEMLGDDPQAAKLQQAAEQMKQLQETIANMEAALADKEGDVKFDQKLKAEEAQLSRDKFEVDAQKTQADIDKIYEDIKGGSMDAQAANTNIDAIVSQVDELNETVRILLDNIEEDMEPAAPLNAAVTLEEGELNE